MRDAAPEAIDDDEIALVKSEVRPRELALAPAVRSPA